MSKLILLAALTVFSTYLIAQDQRLNDVLKPKNSLNINLLGDASFASINFEHFFIAKERFVLTGKAGIGYNKKTSSCVSEPCIPAQTYLTIPHHITANFGKEGKFLEFGLGGTVINTSQRYILFPLIGYRFLPLKSSRVNYRIYFYIPLYNVEDVPVSPVGLNIGATL